jgi:TP901 family phage tail tape measure protein
MAELKIDIIAGIDKLSASLKEVESKFGKLGQKLTDVGSSLSLSITAPLTAMGAVAVNEFATVEKGLREINSLFGLTGEEAEKNFGMLTKVAEEASKELGILQSDVVPAMYNAISAGVPKENIFEFIKVAGKAAIGGVTDLNTAVDGLTSIINAFGLSMSEAEAVADSMFAAVQGGKTTFSQLSDSIFNIAPAAAAAGVSFQEVNAAIATLTAGGTPTAVATTQIRAALTGLQRPSKELDAIFQQLGFKTAQLAIEKKGLGFALDAVKKASNGSNGELQTLLGSTEAVAAANVLAGTGAAKFSDELERQANSAGAAANAAAEIDKSFGRELERTKVAASNLGIAIGGTLAPALSSLNGVVEKVISFFSNLSPTTQTIVVAFGAFAAAVGPILLGIGSFISLIPTLTAGLATLKVALGAITIEMAAATAGVSLLVYGLISLSQELARTSQIKAQVQQQLLAESLKETTKEVDALAKKYNEINPNLSENENKLRANEAVLKSYQTALDGVAKTDPKYEEKTTAIKEQIAALESQSTSIKGQIELTKTLTGSTQLGTDKIKEDTKAREERIKKLREESAEFLKTQDNILSKVGAGVSRDAFNPQQTDITKQMSPERLQMVENASARILEINKELGPVMRQTFTEGMTQQVAAYNEQVKLTALETAQINANMETALPFGSLLAESFAQMAESGKLSFASLFDGLKRMAIQLAATVAAAFALNLLLGGLGVAGFGKGAGGFKKLLGGMGGGGPLGGLIPFANGGIVSGPTPALVGEYTGARTNPEVIAPLSKLQNMMGGNVTFTISGDNLVGTLNRANKTRARKF